MWMGVFNSVYQQCEKKGEKNCDVHGAKAAWAAVTRAKEGKVSLFLPLGKIQFTEGVNGAFNVHGFALHPVITRHPGEPPRDYTEAKADLIKAAPTLVGKHFDIDHSMDYPNPTVNVITKTAWNETEQAIEFWGTCDKQIKTIIETNGNVSVDINWLIPDQGGIRVVQIPTGEIGIVPYGFEFNGISVLDEKMTPGDPNAFAEMLESLQRALTLQEGFGDASFPDSCFMWVPEDAKGKDGNKSLRKLPYKNADGSISLPHVRNALARLDQTEDIPATEKDAIRKKLEGILEKENPEYKPVQESHVQNNEVKKMDKNIIELMKEATKKGVDVFNLAKKNAMSLDQVKARLAELSNREQEINDKLWPKALASAVSDEEARTLRAEMETNHSEIEALEIYMGQIIGEADSQKELVAARKEVIDTKAALAEANIVKTQTQQLADARMHEFVNAVESKLPSVQVLGCWTPGPRRFVQEIQSVIREHTHS
jgi:hypothetical protein